MNCFSHFQTFRGSGALNYKHQMEIEMKEKNRSSRVSVWLVIGVLVLIALLIVWLTIADLWGDTDVAAFITRAGALAPAEILVS